MMKYKSLFIDLDDTLWDTYHNNKECLEEVYTAHHFDRYYASFEAFFEIYWPHNNLLWEQYRNNEIDRQTLIIERFRYMLRPLGIEDTKSVLAINNDFLQRTTRKTRLVPGAIELLEYLRPSYRMYILSNGFREVQFKKLCNSGLAPYFKRMILSEDACIQKPHSWEADIIGAHNSKIDQLWLNPKGLPAKEFIPTYTVGSLEEIKRIL